MSKEVYIAAPFFNDHQISVVEHIKECLKNDNLQFFSPKDESMFKQGDDPKTILNLNCEALDDARLTIVVTDGKDVGTIWEAGYSYAKGTQILYVWLERTQEQKFNVMLAASGQVVHDWDSLMTQLFSYSQTGRLIESVDESMLHE